MTTIKDACRFLDSFAPTRLAEEWDNVGLLVGDAAAEANQIMTCLTVTPESVAEAIEKRVDLIVSHHPLPFRPLKRLTTDATPSKLLWDLIRGGVSIYSPHTGFDSAAEGINFSLTQRLGLTDVKPLVPIVGESDAIGAGRLGTTPDATLAKLIERIKREFAIETLQYIGQLDSTISRVAVACGSGGSFLEKARRAKCDAFVTGETTFHTCLEASANNVSMVLLGHYTSERFAVEALADLLGQTFPQATVWASEQESDPVSWV